jgi:hypothetical protein
MKKSIKMKKNKKPVNNLHLILAIALIVITLLNIGIALMNNSEFKKLTGFATSTGYVNLTVNTNIAVAISPTWGINWSNGSINAGSTNATLITVRNTSTVDGGNWSTVGVSGILIINTGNVNATLTINGTKNNTDWFGAIAVPSNYSWNVSNMLPGSCTGGNPLNSWIGVNHSAITYCTQFSSLSTSNQIWFDVKLQVPSTTANTNLPLSDTITVTASAAP